MLPQLGRGRPSHNVGQPPDNLLTGQAAQGGSTPDAINEAYFSDQLNGAPLSPGIVGITARLYNSNNAFVETDIVFNSSVSWNSYRGALRADSLDFCRVATHELGHTLGLDYPDTHEQNVVAIMNSVTSNVDSPAADDIAGIQYLHGTRTPNNNPVGNVPAKPVITYFITYSGDFNGDGKQDILWRNTHPK